MKQLPTTIKGIAESLLAAHPELSKRIAKAIDLLHRPDRIFFVAHIDGSPVYRMVSSDGSTSYTVEAGACTCPARGLCYHRVARGIMTIRSANLTRVAFDEAIAAEDSEPPPPQTEESAPPAEYVGPAYTPPTGESSKRVQSSGRMNKGLTIRASMDALGKRLVEVFSARQEVAK